MVPATLLGDSIRHDTHRVDGRKISPQGWVLMVEQPDVVLQNLRHAADTAAAVPAAAAVRGTTQSERVHLQVQVLPGGHELNRMDPATRAALAVCSNLGKGANGKQRVGAQQRLNVCILHHLARVVAVAGAAADSIMDDSTRLTACVQGASPVGNYKQLLLSVDPEQARTLLGSPMRARRLQLRNGLRVSVQSKPLPSALTTRKVLARQGLSALQVCVALAPALSVAGAEREFRLDQSVLEPTSPQSADYRVLQALGMLHAEAEASATAEQQRVGGAVMNVFTLTLTNRAAEALPPRIGFRGARPGDVTGMLLLRGGTHGSSCTNCGKHHRHPCNRSFVTPSALAPDPAQVAPLADHGTTAARRPSHIAAAAPHPARVGYARS